MITLIAAMAAGVFAGVPSLNSASVSSQSAGACNVGGGLAFPAKVFIGWSITNPNDADYTIKVYENGALLGTGNTSDAGYTKTITGSVQHGVTGESPSGEWTSNWTYRIDLVRNSDGVAIASKTTSAWVQTYGVCT